MKKFLWFLIGMALIIAIPLLLFSGGTSSKKTSPQDMGKPVTVKEIPAKNVVGK